MEFPEVCDGKSEGLLDPGLEEVSLEERCREAAGPREWTGCASASTGKWGAGASPPAR